MPLEQSPLRRSLSDSKLSSLSSSHVIDLLTSRVPRESINDFTRFARVVPFVFKAFGTSVAKSLRMKRTCIRTLIMINLLVLPLFTSVEAQETLRVSRRSIAGMDVLTRARLFEPSINRIARSEGVDPLILWTIAYNETRFRPWLTSPKNAQGLMQFMPATASRFGLTNPYEPVESITAAARHVKYLGRIFDWRLESILAAYNAGEGTVNAYLQGRALRVNGKSINAGRRTTNFGIPPYTETIAYVAQGVRIYRSLQAESRFKITRPILQATRTTPSESPINEAAQGFETVLYDPRTGKRMLIREGLSQITSPIESGPIVITDVIGTTTNQKARSIFAGVISTADRRD